MALLLCHKSSSTTEILNFHSSLSSPLCLECFSLFKTQMLKATRHSRSWAYKSLGKTNQNPTRARQLQILSWSYQVAACLALRNCATQKECFSLPVIAICTNWGGNGNEYKGMIYLALVRQRYFLLQDPNIK